MNPSRIEQTIEEIYAFIEECKSSKLYPNKVVVAKDELYDLLDALRLCAPEEIKRYQKIINNRDHILGEAQRNAEQMVNQAKQQTVALLDESDMVQAARNQADAIMKEQYIVNYTVRNGEVKDKVVNESNQKINGMEYTPNIIFNYIISLPLAGRTKRTPGSWRWNPFCSVDYDYNPHYLYSQQIFVHKIYEVV